MLIRREALLSAGLLDERFFLYCEEADLCLRIKRTGWSVRHLPAMTIMHHIGKGGHDPRIDAQQAYSRRQFARKHFGPVHRLLFLARSASATRSARRRWSAARTPGAPGVGPLVAARALRDRPAAVQPRPPPRSTRRASAARAGLT